MARLAPQEPKFSAAENRQYPALKAFHKPQCEHPKQEMPPRKGSEPVVTAVTEFTVQIQIAGSWRQDGKNRRIDLAKAQKRVAKLQTEGRQARIVESESHKVVS